MATEKELRKRIRSIKNISQVTGALGAVSAARARKAQAQVLATRNYAGKAFEVLNNLAAQSTAVEHPLLNTRSDIKQAMVVLITADRGLCGAYNANIVRLAEKFISALDVPAQLLTIGRKGRDLMIRRGYNVVATFDNLPSSPSILDITPIARLLTEDYLAGKVDEVFIAYTDYINLASQRPSVKQLLPLKAIGLLGDGCL